MTDVGYLIQSFTTSFGLLHIFENILAHLSLSDLINVSRVCKDWHHFTNAKPEIWERAIKRILAKRVLVNPEMKIILQKVNEGQDKIRFAHILNQFNLEEPARHSVLVHEAYLQLVYGDIKRLKYFWPLMSNKALEMNVYLEGIRQVIQPVAFFYAATKGHIKVFQFMKDQVKPDCKIIYKCYDFAKRYGINSDFIKMMEKEYEEEIQEGKSKTALFTVATPDESTDELAVDSADDSADESADDSADESADES